MASKIVVTIVHGTFARKSEYPELEVSTLALPLALLIGFLAYLPFGPEFALRGAFLQVSVESTPPGTWSVHQFQALEQGGLHAASYQHPGALREIVDFIRRHSMMPAASNFEL